MKEEGFIEAHGPEDKVHCGGRHDSESSSQLWQQKNEMNDYVMLVVRK